MRRMSHCGLGQTAGNAVHDAWSKFRPAFERRLQAREFAPAIDLDAALGAGARGHRPRRRRRALERGGLSGQMDILLHHRRAADPVHAGPDDPGGGEGGGRLCPASLPSSRIHAARQLQAVHRDRQRPHRLRLHDEGGDRAGGRGRHARAQRDAPLAGADAVRRGQPLLPGLREERQLPVAGARLRIRDDDAAFRRISSPISASTPRTPTRSSTATAASSANSACARAATSTARTCSRSAGAGIESKLIVNSPTGKLGRQRVRDHRQGGACLPGRRDPDQARRLRRADRRAQLRPRADQRRGRRLRNSRRAEMNEPAHPRRR